MKNLEKLLNPKSVAVVGASREKKKLGRLLLDNIIDNGYKGKVYPVNPKTKKLRNLKCFASVLDIKDSVDLVVIAIPAKFVLDVVKECCEKKVGSIAIISAGFSEASDEGLLLEMEIKKLAQENGIVVLGPNCLGVISTKTKLNATFAKNEVKPGEVAFLSQSGALGTAGLDWAEKNDLGFAYFISIGNKADLSENTFIEHFSNDPTVKVIALYLEDFSDGRNFMKVASECKKPVIVLKPGRSLAAQEALGLHTGSLAQDDRISSAAMKQSGVVRVETIEDLFNLLKIFSWTNSLKGNKIAIITNAGGPGVVTTDAVELTGLKLADLERKTKRLLELKLPPACNTNNPVDVLGDALADRYEIALREVVNDDNVDAVVVLLTPQVMTEVEKTAQMVVKYAKSAHKIVVAAFIGGEEAAKGRKVLIKNKIPTFFYPVDAVKAISYMWTNALKTPDFAEATSGGQKSKIKNQNVGKIEERRKKQEVINLQDFVKKGKTLADIPAVRKLLKSYKIPLLRSYFPNDIADARRAASKLKYPIVLKISDERLLHRTEKDAVILDIQDDKDLGVAYEELEKLAKSEGLGGAKIEMQHFVKDALELIIGVKYDVDQHVVVKGQKILRKRGFGHTILFGMGGIYTEVYQDISLGVLPLSPDQIDKLLSKTKIDKVLRGFRGREYNRKKIIEVISNVCKLVADYRKIRELDINPLFVKGKEVWVVDVKALISA